MKSLTLRKAVLLTVVLLLVVVAGATVSYTDAFALVQTEEHQDPPPDPGGGGGGCTHCDYDNCGCASPPPGCVMYFSCTCSSLDCTRTCTPDC